MFTTSAAVVLSVSALAQATIFVTSPVASTSYTAGQQATISWMDDGKTPSLKDFGASSVGIYVGNAQQQTLLQMITPSVDVSTTGTIQFVPSANIGPNGNDYFIRFDSINLKDGTPQNYPELAFSAKYSMSNMNGQFNSTVQAQINGQSTAPLAAPAAGSGAPAAASSAPAASSTTQSKMATVASSTKPTTTGSAQAANASSPASRTTASLAAVFVALFAAAF